jgi:transposase
VDRNTFFDVPDELWALVEPLLPPEPPKEYGGRPRVPARRVFAAIVYRLRTGCQWKAIPRTLVDGGTAHRWFARWVRAGVFERLHTASLRDHDRRVGLAWLWCSMDTALIKAPKGGPHRSEPDRSREVRL